MRYTLLLVGEEGVIAAAIQRQLADAYAVDRVSTGMAAIAQCRNDPPDCVLVDLALSDMDGVDFVLALRRVGSALPIVVMSGLARIWMLRPPRNGDYLVQGALQKPFAAPALRQVLDGVMASRRIDQSSAVE